MVSQVPPPARNAPAYRTGLGAPTHPPSRRCSRPQNPAGQDSGLAAPWAWQNPAHPRPTAPPRRQGELSGVAGSLLDNGEET
jgi:hypothetical protein